MHEYVARTSIGSKGEFDFLWFPGEDSTCTIKLLLSFLFLCFFYKIDKPLINDVRTTGNWLSSSCTLI